VQAEYIVDAELLARVSFELGANYYSNNDGNFKSDRLATLGESTDSFSLRVIRRFIDGELQKWSNL